MEAGDVETVARFQSEDGKTVVSVVRSGDLFRFIEEQELWSPPSNGLGGYSYRAETERSGLYATLEDAVAAWKASRGDVTEFVSAPRHA